ncbi:MAG TPA: fused MFS/spermidine synthase [Terriglobia bacterium]|nr:fused MFS/spermidine synthase [Terriglobia bacterium]
MIAVFLGLTLFLSAFLLFCIQPIVAKMALPFLGGSSSVWATCVLFFQSILLAGYAYAHGLARRLSLGTQMVVHGAVMVSVFAFLPIRFSGPADESAVMGPTVWLLWRLVLAAGVPFFVLSATAPLAQTWLTRTNLKWRHDPYFLYAASNAGSLLALVAYPLAIEPWTGARAQSWSWVAGYGLLAVMMMVAAGWAWRRVDPDAAPVAGAPAEEASGDTAIAQPAWTPLYWLAAAAVPSALMLAVTNQISMDVASVPFLWILPLAIYLLTFILAFSGNKERSVRSARFLGGVAPAALLALLPIVPMAGPDQALYNWLLAGGHLVILFLGAYLCHTSLAAHRPPAGALTSFYLWIALGGALGGLFVALVAPRIFSTVLEYPLLVAALPFFRISGEHPRWGWRDGIWPVAILSAALAARGLQGESYKYWLTVVFAAVFLMRRHHLRFALSFAALLFGYVHGAWGLSGGTERLLVARNFFGTKRVLYDESHRMLKLLHGNTLHGYESLDPELAGEPLSYFHRDGPAGDAMRSMEWKPMAEIGVVGLGTGSMAAYAGPNRHITFFDVDPQVVEIARHSFSFLDRCGARCSVTLGDGRLSIGRMADGTFDVLMLDAFNSDSIPAHLVSREAIQIFLRKLKPDGMILFHVSSRYLNIARLVAAAVTDARLTAFIRNDAGKGPAGKLASTYIAVARDKAALGTLAGMRGWQPLEPEVRMAPWTDDYSNMLGLIVWGGDQ